MGVKELEVSVLPEGQTAWRVVGTLAPGTNGSISDLSVGRDVFLFGWEREFGADAVVATSKGGIDVEVGAMRAITSLAGWEVVATLAERHDRWEKEILSPKGIRMRFRVEAK